MQDDEDAPLALLRSAGPVIMNKKFRKPIHDPGADDDAALISIVMV